MQRSGRDMRPARSLVIKRVRVTAMSGDEGAGIRAHCPRTECEDSILSVPDDRTQGGVDRHSLFSRRHESKREEDLAFHDGSAGAAR